MTLRLSVNRCGFDMGSGELRDAIADLTLSASEIGAAIGMLNATVSAPPTEVRATASALRIHRNWLLEQVELLRAKLRLCEKRAREAVVRRTVESMTVTLFPSPHAPVIKTREERAVQ
ncbi:hypothetical protein GCM10010873_16220 [Cypionkella aquatica]|uniref:Uncharacterized protein n=1 Tax=Cypionkella aquatica TaxID=1756042 RepID=A0AA37TVL6_9RHOB|nr:hypothetical protein [Cypionkella aquatica]GLS86648.1 hypothetical protein GCM10010873_16220 [Cypionkella aquatica]